MPITSNGYYNSPQMAQAFANLGQIFAPPSAQDSAAFATARARNQQAAQLASLFDYARDGAGFDQTTFDRMGQAAGQWNPSNGYYGVDTTANTARRGQDITAATSLENNRADNARQAVTSLYGALNPGQVAPALPPEISAAIGLPSVGERRGAAPILSETQVKGQFLQGLTPEQQMQVALGDVPVETIITGSGPQIAPRGAAWGATPYDKPGSQAAPQNYLTPDGRRGTARMSPAGMLVDTQTGEPLPQGSSTFSTRAQGTNADLGLPTTANQTTANNAEAVYNAMDADINAMRTLLQNNPGIAGIPGDVRGAAQNAVSVLDETRAAFGDLPPDAKVSAGDVENALRRVAPTRNPAIAQYRLLMTNMAYRLAQMNNPTGEVSRQAFERSMESLNGGLLSNNQSVLEAMDALAAQNSRNRDNYLRTLRAPGQVTPGAAPPTAPAAPSMAPTGPRTIETPAGRVTIQRVD